MKWAPTKWEYGRGVSENGATYACSREAIERFCEYEDANWSNRRNEEQKDALGALEEQSDAAGDTDMRWSSRLGQQHSPAQSAGGICLPYADRYPHRRAQAARRIARLVLLTGGAVRSASRAAFFIMRHSGGLRGARPRCDSGPARKGGSPRKDLCVDERYRSLKRVLTK